MIKDKVIINMFTFVNLGTYDKHRENQVLLVSLLPPHLGKKQSFFYSRLYYFKREIKLFTICVQLTLHYFVPMKLFY